MSNSTIGAKYALDFRSRRSKLPLHSTIRAPIRKWAKEVIHKLDRTTGATALAKEVKALHVAIKEELRASYLEQFEDCFTLITNKDWEAYLESQFPLIDDSPEPDPIAEEDLTWSNLEFRPVLGSHAGKNPGTRLAMLFQVSREDDGYEGYEAFGDA